MNFFSRLMEKLSTIAIKRSLQAQLRSELRDPGLWGLQVNGLGHITVEGLDTVELADQYDTPLLVVSKTRLHRDGLRVKAALDEALPRSRVLFSYKTNCIPRICREVHRLGIGAEVISPYELWLARKLGVPGHLIVYNGVDKSDESIESAIEMNILSINVDHMEEIDRIHGIARRLNRKAACGVRLGLVEHSQFGLNMETGEAMEVCKRIVALSDHLELVCVHFNVTSNARSAFIHRVNTLRALEFMARVKEETGIDIPFLDIGGGIGVPTSKNMSGLEYGLYRLTGALPSPPSPVDFQSLEDFFHEIGITITEFCRMHRLLQPRVIIEPGRCISSSAELLLARVKTVKEKSDGTRFAITDAGRLSLTFPCDFEYHEIFVANRAREPLSETYHVMGRICTSADWMVKNRLMPRLQPGDVLAAMDAGAYFSSYSTTFAFPRPAILMVDEGNAEIVRNRETFDHLTALDVGL